MKGTLLGALFGALICSFLFGAGFFTGHRYTIKERAPNAVDFRFTDKFTTLISEELSKFNKSSSWVYNIDDTIDDPTIRIWAGDEAVEDTFVTTTKKFERKINIRKEIVEKVLVPDNHCGYKEDFEKVRPLAKEIAEKIITVQPNRG